MKIFLSATALLSCEYKVRARAKTTKQFPQNITIFLTTERKILACRYFFSMSDEESHSESKFYYPEEEERPKLSKTT